MIRLADKAAKHLLLYDLGLQIKYVNTLYYMNLYHLYGEKHIYGKKNTRSILHDTIEKAMSFQI